MLGAANNFSIVSIMLGVAVVKFDSELTNQRQQEVDKSVYFLDLVGYGSGEEDMTMWPKLILQQAVA